MISKILLRRFLIAGAALVLLLSACNCRQQPAQTITADNKFQSPQNNTAGLTNFAGVSDTLYRGAQPDAEGFRQLKKMGIKTIINLRSMHSDKTLIKGLGFRYLEIPSDAGDIEEAHVSAFLKAAADPANAPVFVHCQHGSDRTGLMVALYRLYVMGWSKEEALKELEAFGRHGIYINIPRYINGFDKDKFKIKLDAYKGPVVELID